MTIAGPASVKVTLIKSLNGQLASIVASSCAALGCASRTRA